MNKSFLYIKLAFQALRANTLRSFLTTLGIIIGIVTVIMVFALGEGTQKIIENEVLAYGANTVFVEVKVPGLSDTNPGAVSALVEGITITSLNTDDMEANAQIPGVTNTYAGLLSTEKVVSIYDNQTYMIQGTTYAYPEIDQADVEYGRYFTDAEDKGIARVAVIGKTVAEELFPGIDPIGQSLRVKGVNLRVIGVMEELGLVFFQNLDEQVYIPLNTMQKLVLGIDYVPYYVIEVENDELAPLIKEDVLEMLDYRHNISTVESRDFRVTTIEEAVDLLSVVTDALQILLTVLATISLIVGGVGVMNIMFVAVTERTREIGLRKALGATKNAIMYQFLWESLMVTLFGGLIGIITGVSLVYFSVWIAGFMGIEIGFFMPLNGILIAVGAAILEGLVFGLYPARKAASLNPIESLRYE
jgi:putative ABC transport system permease protein